MDRIGRAIAPRVSRSEPVQDPREALTVVTIGKRVRAFTVARSATAKEAVAAYESECEPEGLYGALYVRSAFVRARPVSRRE